MKKTLKANIKLDFAIPLVPNFIKVSQTDSYVSIEVLDENVLREVGKQREEG